MSLAMDLAACVICGGENGISGCHLAVFSVAIALAHNFVALTTPPIEVLVALAMPIKTI